MSKDMWSWHLSSQMSQTLKWQKQHGHLSIEACEWRFGNSSLCTLTVLEKSLPNLLVKGVMRLDLLTILQGKIVFLFDKESDLLKSLVIFRENIEKAIHQRFPSICLDSDGENTSADVQNFILGNGIKRNSLCHLLPKATVWQNAFCKNWVCELAFFCSRASYPCHFWKKQ